MYRSDDNWNLMWKVIVSNRILIGNLDVSFSPYDHVWYNYKRDYTIINGPIIILIFIQVGS